MIEVVGDWEAYFSEMEINLKNELFKLKEALEFEEVIA